MAVAIHVTDWNGLERIAQTALHDCSGIDDDESLSADHENIADSRMNRNDPGNALKAADECIQTYYANAACHEIRGAALLQLGRVNDARDQFAVAARVTAVATSDCQDKLQGIDGSSDVQELKAAKKLNLQSKLRKLQAIAELIATIQAHWSSLTQAPAAR